MFAFGPGPIARFENASMLFGLVAFAMTASVVVMAAKRLAAAKK
jgi:hypothetical protein